MDLNNWVLNMVKPTDDEDIFFREGALKIKRKLIRAAKELSINCDVFIGGSFGKGTYLKGSSDVDFFVRFSVDYPENKLSLYLENILVKSGIDYKKQKGSRDYFSGVFSPRKYNIKFETVPVYKIRKVLDAKNSTDLSPMHVKFVSDRINLNPNLSDEIRIAKQFFKAKKLYGAESYINGFSGHVIDILIINYGSFQALIDDAKTWEDTKVIDVLNVYNSFDKLKKAFGSDKISDLIVVDPIIKNRNAARAVSNDNYNRFLFEVNTLKKLSKSDFETYDVDFAQVLDETKDFAKSNNLKRVCYDLKFDSKSESFDIVGSKLKKLYGKVLKYFESFDFVVFYSEFIIDVSKGRCLFIYFFEKVDLPNIKKILGPKVTMVDSISKFLEKREMHFIEGDRVCSYDIRRVTKLEEIYKLEILDFEEMLSKEISFVKKLKIIR